MIRFSDRLTALSEATDRGRRFGLAGAGFGQRLGRVRQEQLAATT